MFMTHFRSQIIARLRKYHETIPEIIKIFEQAPEFRLQIVDANVEMNALPDLAQSLARKCFM